MGVSDVGEAPIVALAMPDACCLLPLSIEAGWNQVAADWRLMLRTGRGFGIRARGSWIASGLALPLGPSLWWISMLLVTAPSRRRGHGRRLLARCMAEIAATGAAMGLDATELGRPIYSALGFRDAYPITRWSRGPTAASRAPPAGAVEVRAATADDLAAIAEYDKRLSGFERGHLLGPLLARAPRLAHLARHADGRLAGYVLGRDGHRAQHIGPVVADDAAVANALIATAAGSACGGVIIDVPDHHDAVGSSLLAAGASASRRFVRMLRGTAPDLPVVEAGKCVFAVAGPELA